jgi:Protein of unknown function (DUF4238)
MTSKRHHYVPQFYLRGFTDEDDRFWVYEKGKETPRVQTPLNTAIIGRFYTFNAADGTPTDELERRFAELEDRMRPILEQWKQARATVQPAHMETAVAFLSFMHTRVPSAVRQAREIHSAFAIGMMKAYAENPKAFRMIHEKYRRETGNHELPFETLLDHARHLEERFSVDANEKPAMLEMLRSTMAVPYELVKFGWTLCRAARGSTFITSDGPFTAFSRRGDKALVGAGFGLPNAEVSFPVSPEVCLLLRRGVGDGRMVVGKKFVAEINKRTAFHAQRIVIARYASQATARLVRRASITLNRPRIDKQYMIDRFRSELSAKIKSQGEPAAS